ncbi:MAG TPA: M23 family metallopeptidase [Pilimelia sp.]|nr:M23 family metallopeptidase [Pilimelia sp.]
MSISEVQARIGQLQSLIAAAHTAPTTAAGRAASGTSGTSGTAAGAPATQFAAALQTAVARTAATAAPGAAATPAATPVGAVAANRPAAVANAWTSPVRGANVSSEYGPRWGTQHEGMDFAVATGTPIRAAKGGVVKKAAWYGGYGNAVILDHGNGVKTLYGHNSALSVKEGQRVAAGQVIAKAGSTGDSTGPHLHFEVHVKDKPVDPRPWLKKHGVRI